MKSNVFLIIEILIVVTFIFLFLDKFIVTYHLDIKGFKEEDIMASLISLNYINFSSIYDLESLVCSIIQEITSEYEVYINNTLVCKGENVEYEKTIKTFYIINGEIFYVLIKI